jgi:hypothetical protein
VQAEEGGCEKAESAHLPEMMAHPATVTRGLAARSHAIAER